MFSRRVFVALAAVAASCAMLPPGAHAQQAKYTAKIGHLEAATQPRHRGLEKVAALVAERTKGEVELKLFPASQLGNARQMIEGTQFGAMEGTVMPAAFLGGFNPVVSILDIPFILPADPAKAQEMRDGPLGKYILDSFTSRGLTAIALWPNGTKSVTSNKPLTSVESFKGQKFRVMDSKILMAQFGAVGASAVAVPFNELYTALQTGLVDGQENPLDTISTMKYQEVQKYLVRSEHGAMEDVVIFNPAWWGSLPQGHRDVILATFLEVRQEVAGMKTAAQEDALKILAGSGMTVRDLTADERAKWRAQMYPPARTAYVERAGRDGQKAIEIYEAEARRLGAD